MSRCLEYFLYFLTPHVKEVILIEMNKQMEVRALASAEFVKYLGLWLLMSTVSNVCSRHYFWDGQPPSKWSGAPLRFHKYMSYTRFKNIMKVLCYSNT